MTRTFKASMIAVGLAAAFAATAQATPITTTGLTITNGDKTFSSFTCSVSTSSGAATPLSCADISVGSVTVGGLLGIEITGNFSALATGIVTASSEDVKISYIATAAAPNQITDIHMNFNGGVTNIASTSVIEQAFNAANTGQLLGQIMVSNPPPVFSDFTLLSSAEPSIFVTKDIALSAFQIPAGTTSLAALSIIDQTFSQVPEPGTLALFGVGLLGLGAALRWRKKA